MRDLEIMMVLLAFNFIPKRSHHSLILPRSQFRDSATVTLTPGDGTTAIILKYGKYLRGAQEEHHGAKTLPCGTSDTTKQFTPTTVHHNVLWSI